MNKQSSKGLRIAQLLRDYMGNNKIGANKLSEEIGINRKTLMAIVNNEVMVSLPVTLKLMTYLFSPNVSNIVVNNVNTSAPSEQEPLIMKEKHHAPRAGKKPTVSPRLQKLVNRKIQVKTDD